MRMYVLCFYYWTNKASKVNKNKSIIPQLSLITEDYFFDADRHVFERFNDLCKTKGIIDIPYIVDVNKDFRIMRDLIKNNQINYNAIKKSTDICDDEYIGQIFISHLFR